MIIIINMIIGKTLYSKDGGMLTITNYAGILGCGNVCWGGSWKGSLEYEKRGKVLPNNTVCAKSGKVIANDDKYDICDKCGSIFDYDVIENYLFDIKQECPACKAHWARLPRNNVNSKV